MSIRAPSILAILSGGILLEAAHPAFAQPDFLWSQFYGDTSSRSLEECTCLFQVQDGGYFLTGYTREPTDSGDVQFSAARVDKEGRKIWFRTYGGRGMDLSNWSVPTVEGGFLAVGIGLVDDVTGGCILKTDAVGDSLWYRCYPDYYNIYGLSPSAVDGNYAFGGQCSDVPDIGLVKIDGNGDVIWSHAYGGNKTDECYALIPTADGGYIAAGRTNSFSGGADMYAVKVDADGDLQWSNAFGTKTNEIAQAVVQTRDGGYAFAGTADSGHSPSRDFCLVRADSGGEMLWSRTYGLWGGVCTSLCLAPDGGFVLAGDNPANGSDFCMIRTDSAGEELWRAQYGGDRYEHCDAAITTSDGGYALAGRTSSYFDRNHTPSNFWLVKTGADPAYNGTRAEHTLPQDFILYPASPNPFNSMTSIRYEIPTSAPVSVRIFDFSGRLITTLFNGHSSPGLHQLLWNASALQAGTYFAHFQSGRFSQSKKLTLVK